jgi:mRNA export factor
MFTTTATATNTSLANNAANDVLVANSPTEAVTSVRFGVTQATANYLLASSWNKDVGIWEISSTGQTALKLKQTSTCGVLCSSWSGDGGSAFIGGTDGQLRMWNIQANTLTAVGTHGAGIKEVFYSTDLNCVVTGSWDKTIKYWDLRSSTPVATVNLTDRVYSMDLKGQLLVAATADKKLTIFHLKTPSTPFRTPFESPLKCQTRSVACFPDMVSIIHHTHSSDLTMLVIVLMQYIFYPFDEIIYSFLMRYGLRSILRY